MNKFGLRRRVARSKPLLTPLHRRLRREWALKNKNLDWTQGLYTDEAKVWIGGGTIQWVTRMDHEAFSTLCVKPRVKKGHGVMLWAGICHGGRTELIRVDTSKSKSKRKGMKGNIYLEQIVKKPLLAAWRKLVQQWRGYGTPFILQDNVKLHWTPEN
ncbi:hypothetical protein TREMEDRAFT_62127 [Tremella mesenterica DSM 1558]|uniref:uncharacterized protein n=1 Tax=Tremella mesenterica (strain ATCC 24925 / CBS 8224 / DSM 1558 / NBRC 9311 / NRRL Y-6157 / RJB 2259-6 / UBC 559-6) TaxID=578456 RepID=UPI0003F4A666|nr:uncharacterized protein TREMEDRAFT_62127 [Tremella mesenterica DSM 1558]EIW69269.1 hypothetical protein TREMEDRAFT_62127 [Tremella mesenterica DSM 1558]